MPRKDLDQEAYEKLLDQRSKRAKSKVTGGRAFDFGYEFQEFVCIFELLTVAREAVEGASSNAHVHRQTEGLIDDVRVWRDDFRRYIQVRGGSGVYWDANLIISYIDQYEEYIKSPFTFRLELCVDSDENRVRMDKNVPMEGDANYVTRDLAFVRTYNVNSSWMTSPHLQLEIILCLERIAPELYHDDLWFVTFWSVLAAFRSSGSTGSLSDLFDVVATLCKYDTVRFSKPSEDFIHREWLIDELNEILELSFVEDGDIVSVTLPDEETIKPSTIRFGWSDNYENFLDRPPETSDEFFRRVKGYF